MTWQGGHGAGGSEYSEAEYRRVVSNILAHPTRRTAEEISLATRVDGRTIRAIVSDADGVEFVLTLGEGIGVATCTDEAHEGTRRLRSQATKMLERAARRDGWAQANLPTLQGGLW